MLQHHARLQSTTVLLPDDASQPAAILPTKDVCRTNRTAAGRPRSVIRSSDRLSRSDYQYRSLVPSGGGGRCDLTQHPFIASVVVVVGHQQQQPDQNNNNIDGKTVDANDESKPTKTASTDELRQLLIRHRDRQQQQQPGLMTTRTSARSLSFDAYSLGGCSATWTQRPANTTQAVHRQLVVLQIFGKRSGAGHNSRRVTDCLVLEPSDMIVIDYPDSSVFHHQSVNSGVHPLHAHRPPQTGQHFYAAHPANQHAPPPRRSFGHLNSNLAPIPPPHRQPPAHHQQSTSTTAQSSSSSSTLSGNSHSRASTLTRQHGPSGQSRSTSQLCGNSIVAAAPIAGMKYFESSSSHRSTVEVNVSSPSGSVDSSRPHSSSHPQPQQQHSGAVPKLRQLNRTAIPPTGSESASSSSATAQPTVLHVNHHHHHHNGTTGKSINQPSTRSSTSSAYSGSLSTTATNEIDDELAGLPETTVDSDEDDDESCPSGDSLMELRDVVRLALEKEPADRSEDDLRVLLDFMQHMPAFANMPVGVKRQLCQHMVFALVEHAGDVVMKDGEQLDSWCVLVNGEIEVTTSDGARSYYHLGDSFGVQPRPESQFHNGQMKALVDDCQFVLIAQEDYVRIMSTVTEHLQKHTDAAGEIVSETERRVLDNREGYVLIKGRPDTLLNHLIEDRDNTIDPYYVEDFLLMYRTFIKSPLEVFERMIKWFDEPTLREKVARLVLLWVNNHFNDFETSSEMMDRLQHFEHALDREGLHNHQSLLNIACSVKSRPRTVTYTRSDRDQVLHFSLLGGFDKEHGLYISKVDAGSLAEKVGLKRGDEVLEVNNQNFQHLSHSRALELLRASTHLSITVKSNLLGFKEMLAASDNQSACSSNSTESKASSQRPQPTGVKTRSCVQLPAGAQSPRSGRVSSASGASLKSVQPNNDHAASNLNKIRSLMSRIKKPTFSITERVDAEMTLGALADEGRKHAALKHSRSNPDIAAHQVQNPQSATAGFATSDNISQYYKPVKTGNPEHVLKIYRSDQTYKYLTVYKETSAQNVVQLALQEFGLTSDPSVVWCLCECSVSEGGVIKQRRLPDNKQNLAELCPLNSRYYLKNNSVSETLVPDSLAPEILKEAQIQLLQLNAHMIAAQMTLQDYSVFASIEPTEYVDNLWAASITGYGWPKLAAFEDLVNREMWWVATEITSERSHVKRAKLIKKFIKVARHCRDFRNFNSMFAIMSGLAKPAVARLQQTWKQVNSKYMKQFEDLQQLLDPSRNMSRYRQHLALVSAEPPCVPLLPMIKKDLTFIRDGNASHSQQGLVNFERLRMIAKEIRAVTKLASCPYELSMMSEATKGGRLNDALLHMNSFEGGSQVATIRKHHTTKHSTQPRKKLYEQALMVRKVKSYLSGLDVVSVESELDRMSCDCEPPAHNTQSLQSHSSSTLPGLSRASPSPSGHSASSADSHRMRIPTPKFGVESPVAVQKMLSLVDHSRVRPVSLAASPAGSAHTISGQSASRRGGGAPPPANQQQRRQSLNADCGSVQPGSRQSNCSIASSDAGGQQKRLDALSHAVSCDSTDSGHVSLQSHKTNANGSPESPQSTTNSNTLKADNSNSVVSRV